MVRLFHRWQRSNQVRKAHSRFRPPDPSSLTAADPFLLISRYCVGLFMVHFNGWFGSQEPSILDSHEKISWSRKSSADTSRRALSTCHVYMYPGLFAPEILIRSSLCRYQNDIDVFGQCTSSSGIFDLSLCTDGIILKTSSSSPSTNRNHRYAFFIYLA